VEQPPLEWVALSLNLMLKRNLHLAYGYLINMAARIIAWSLVVFKFKRLYLGLLPKGSKGGTIAKLRRALFIKTNEFLAQKNQAVLLEELLLNTLRNYERWKPAHKPISWEPKKPKFIIQPQLRTETFREVYQLLKEVYPEVFICFGVLLGQVREGDFLKHDLDLDFGMFYEEGLVEKVKEAFEQKGYHIKIFEPSPWPCRLVAKHPTSELSLEIVMFKQEEDALLTYTKYRSHLLIRRRKHFALEKVNFAGMEVLRPSNPKLFLEENYGNWQEPSEYHHWIITSPLTNFNEKFLQPLLLGAIFINLYQHKFKAAQALIVKWNACRPDEPIKILGN
jgi:hypothetical protein